MSLGPGCDAQQDREVPHDEVGVLVEKRAVHRDRPGRAVADARQGIGLIVEVDHRVQARVARDARPAGKAHEDGVDLASEQGVDLEWRALDRVDIDEIAGQRKDVAGPIPQGVHPDPGDRQSVEEILAKVAGGHGFLELHVGGGNQSDVDRYRMARAEAHHLALLQDPQQLDLRPQRKIADLVEKQRAAVRGLEPPCRAGDRARKSAFFVAEQIALDQGLREGPAVDRHKWLPGTVGELVDVPRHDLLAGSGFPRDEHRGVAGGHLADSRPQRVGLRILEYRGVGL